MANLNDAFAELEAQLATFSSSSRRNTVRSQGGSLTKSQVSPPTPTTVDSSSQLKQENDELKRQLSHLEGKLRESEQRMKQLVDGIKGIFF